jgi:hypothetical protein
MMIMAYCLTGCPLAVAICTWEFQAGIIRVPAADKAAFIATTFSDMSTLLVEVKAAVRWASQPRRFLGESETLRLQHEPEQLRFQLVPPPQL